MTALTANPEAQRASTAAEQDRSAAHGALCDHCGLAVPGGLVDPRADAQFCCEGCRTVFHVIRGCGLESYYELLRAAGEAVRPARVSEARYEEFDDPTFASLHVRPGGSGLLAVELYLEGVHCGACVWLIEKLPAVVAGVIEARVALRRQVVRLVWDPQHVNLSAIARRLASLGYAPHPHRGRADDALRREEDGRGLVRIAVAGAIAGNVMVISFALYGGVFHGMEPAYAALLRWTSMLLTLTSLAWPGRAFLRGAWAALRTRTMHMDVPVSVGLLAGCLGSTIDTIAGAGDVYFDSLTVLIFLLLLGRWLQARQQRTARSAVELLFSMTPSRARLVDSSGIREVPIEALRLGQLVEVRAGDSFPVDGVIMSGSSTINASMLTGESIPASAAPGDAVHAGTTNVAAPLRVRVDATGEKTRVGQLMQLVENAASSRPPIVRLADRVAGVFAVAVLVLAALSALIWLRIEPSRALPNAMALLIITCPCALGLATPLAVIAGIGRAAQAGTLIKGCDTIEVLNRRGLILFDKTGTVTQGHTLVVEWRGPESLQPVVAAVERGSSHGVARCLVTAYGASDPAGTLEVEQVQETLGCGIEAMVDQRRVLIGSRRFMDARGVHVAGWAADAEQECTRRAVTPVFVAVEGRVEAMAGVGDGLQRDAAESIDALQSMGWRVGILSGDHPEVVRAVAAELGMRPEDCRGGVSPEEKLAAVRGARLRGPVVMVGDGVNDAAALAAASVGVAVRGGAEASLAAADVYLSRSGLVPLVQLVTGARRTMRVIRRNILVSLLYNCLGVGLAVAGLINPLLAAIVMPLSSLTVITLSYRSRTFEA